MFSEYSHNNNYGVSLDENGEGEGKESPFPLFGWGKRRKRNWCQSMVPYSSANLCVLKLEGILTQKKKKKRLKIS